MPVNTTVNITVNNTAGIIIDAVNTIAGSYTIDTITLGTFMLQSEYFKNGYKVHAKWN